MIKEDIEDLKNANRDEINAVLKDLYTLSKYRIINALLALAHCSVVDMSGPDISASETMAKTMELAAKSLRVTASEKEYFPSCLVKKKKANVVYMFGEPGKS